MQKAISILLTIALLFASSIAVCAADSEETAPKIVTAIAVTMEEPTVGGMPTKTGTMPAGASTYVTGINWSGDFDSNGCFQYGGSYTVVVEVSIKPGLDRTIDNWYTNSFTINGKTALFEHKTYSMTEGTLVYTYKNLGVPHQDHCFCGGELTLGEHQTHKTYEYQPWDGTGSIPYVNGVAYVYLTADISRKETLNVPGGKTLNLCLNGHTIRKLGGGRVINTSSGSKLRLCDCSVMQTGTITGGSHQMGGGVHNGGTLVMYGGKITGNEGTYGGGLWNNYNFYMYGGEISFNGATYGAGVWNANSGNAELIIFGGSINKNQGAYGGGLWNNDNGNIVMKGGEFRENIASKCGGAIWNQGKNFFFEDGYIYKNFSRHGGGVWTQSTFTMSGGYLVANEAIFPSDRENGYGGGVWVNDKSIFYMKAGEIAGNFAGMSGGGVWVNDSAEFVMQGGIISGNDAQLGGGVYLQRSENAAPGTFRLSGDAAITGNRGKEAGGGMYIKGILEVTGGCVENNHSNSEYTNLAIESVGEVREGTSLPTAFIDVPSDAYYYQPVLWALERNITSGTSDITFSPNDKCNLAQILTFLWRAAGSPVVKTSPLLADVKKEDYFYMPAYWAQSQGMFSRALYPNTSSNRMVSIYFIWCAAGRPECKTPLKFTDLEDKQYDNYREAIAWAVDQGITSGTSATTFGPGKTCTRAEILTFLWKAVSNGSL